MSDVVQLNICVYGREGEGNWKGLTLCTLVQALPTFVCKRLFPNGCCVVFVMCRGPRWETGPHVRGAVQTH